MADKNRKILKGVEVLQVGTLTPASIELLPAGTGLTKTTLIGSQTANRTITFKDETGTVALMSDISGAAAALAAHIADTTTHGTTGNIVGTTDTQTLTNKTLSGNIASNFVNGAATVTLPTLTSTLATLALTETLSNKTLATPVIAQILTNGGTATLTLPTSTDTLVGRATSDTLSNKTFTFPIIQDTFSFVDQGSDVSAPSAGYTNLYTKPTGLFYRLAGGTVRQAVNLNEAQTLTNKTLTSPIISQISNTGTLTLPTSTDTLVGRATTDVLSNKDIDGGTAANNRRLTVPKDTKANLDTLDRKEGTIVYGTDTDKLYVDDGTNLVQVGSGAGVINFVTNPDAETGTTGWTVDSFAAASRPAGALTGTTTGITFTTSATAPLAGSNSFTFAKDANNRQGRVVYTGLTFTPAYFAKVMNITADMILSSGTFVAGTTTTDSDLIWYIQNVTDGTFIEPSSFKILSNSSTNSFQFNGTFQTAASATSYRLLLYVASTSASAYTMKFDNVVVTPSTYAYGTPITDWQTYTPTLTNGGTTSTNTGRWRRVGDSMEIQTLQIFTGAGSAGDYRVSIPSGYSIDTTKLPTGTSDALGSGLWFDNGVGEKWLTPTGGSSTAVNFAYEGTTGVVLQGNGLANGDYTRATFLVPIVGLSSSVQTSDQTDTRVVSAIYSTGAGTSIGTGSTILDYGTKVADTHGAVTTGASWKFTAPVSGYYTINGSSRFTTAARRLDLYKNGILTLILNEVAVDVTASISAGLFLNQGEYIDFRANAGSTASLFADARFNQIVITRVSGPNQIAANELVAAVYNTAAGQSIPNNTSTVVDFNTKEFDTHNAVSGTGTNWIFTAPISGTYEISAMTMFTSGGGWNIGEAAEVRILKNGATNLGSLYYLNMIAAHSGIVGMPGASKQVKLLAGEYVAIQVYQNTGGSLALFSAGDYNWVSIKRVGL